MRLFLAFSLVFVMVLALGNPAHAAPGDLDTSFSGDGRTTTNITGGDNASDVGVQSDGKIVVAGKSDGSSVFESDFALARYNPDGTLDTTFGGDGKVTTDFGTSADDSDEEIQALTIQPDGKIVVVGSFSENVEPFLNHFAVARYNPNGSLDITFDGDGRLTTSFQSNSRAEDVVLQPDGKIIAVGYFTKVNPDGPGDNDFAFARYNPGGSLDATFGGDGRVTSDFSPSDLARAVTLQTDGKIVAAGGANVARYNPNGSLDTTFDGDGIGATTGIGVSDVALQSDGKIVVAGGTNEAVSGETRFALARYGVNGALDTSFSGDGKQTTDFGGPDDIILGVAVQRDDKIVAAGFAEQSTAGNRHLDFALARYSPNGSPDTSFSGDGKLTTEFPSEVPGFPSQDEAHGIAIQPDGKVVAAGRAWSAKQNFAVARYLGVSSAPPPPVADTTKPSISGMTPRHRSITRDTTPTIRATVRDNLTNLSKRNLKLYVAGKRVTKFRYSGATDRLTYTSPRLTKGKKVVKIVATDAAGNVSTKNWFFTIK